MIDLDIAKAWHAIYAEKIELVASGQLGEPLSPEMVCDDSACKLGRWIYGQTGLEDWPAFVGLKHQHQRFHDLACQFLSSAGKERDSREWQDVAADFHEASARVRVAIDQLKAELARWQQENVPSLPRSIIEAVQPAWDDALNIGIPAIDEHHKAIVRIADQMIKSPEASLHSEHAVDCLSDLGNILGMHFAIEEAHMKQIGMPEDEFAAHRKRHKEIMDQVVDLNIASYSERDRKVKDIASIIKGWAVDHVVDYDLKLRRYLVSSDSRPVI